MRELGNRLKSLKPMDEPSPVVEAFPIAVSEIVPPAMVLNQTRFKHLEPAVNKFLSESEIPHACLD